MKSDMKRTIIFSLLVGAMAFSAVSCMEIDNFDAPESRLSGRVIDRTTGEPILASQGHGRIRIWEMSYDTGDPNIKPDEQEIPLKQDGTYNNQRLFAGTYDAVPLGPWWPCDTVMNIAVGKHTTHDFEVTPYLTLSDFDARLEGTTLYLSCRLYAPEPPAPYTLSDLPMIMDMRPYISRTVWCGPGNDGNMGYYGRAPYILTIGKTWANLAKEDDGKSIVLELPAIDLKAGYTYYVRMGAKVRDQFENFNLTEIKKIVVPL